jgi:hypothetical protein
MWNCPACCNKQIVRAITLYSPCLTSVRGRPHADLPANIDKTHASALVVCSSAAYHTVCGEHASLRHWGTGVRHGTGSAPSSPGPRSQFHLQASKSVIRLPCQSSVAHLQASHLGSDDAPTPASMGSLLHAPPNPCWCVCMQWQHAGSCKSGGPSLTSSAAVGVQRLYTTAAWIICHSPPFPVRTLSLSSLSTRSASSGPTMCPWTSLTAPSAATSYRWGSAGSPVAGRAQHAPVLKQRAEPGCGS